MSGIGPLKGSSVHFVIGSPINDEQLALARAWAESIVTAAGTGVTSTAAVSHAALGLRLLPGRLRLPTSTTTTPATLDDKGRTATQRIPGHALVLIAPCLSDELVLRGLPAAASRLPLGTTGIGKFELSQDWFVMPKAGLTLDPRTDEGGLWLLLWVMRLGIQSIYLCTLDPTASKAKVGGLAKALAKLTRATVYWNDHPVRFESTDTPISEAAKNGLLTRALTRVVVGPAGGVASGPPFVGATDVDLKAAPGQFLPGAQHAESP